jgi:hypothetical protein
MKILFTVLFLLSGFAAFADEQGGGFFIDPYVAVGFNTVQKTYFMGGLDAGYALDQNLRFGLGGHYSAGNDPGNDREIGVGPFIGYSYALTNFLIFNAREDIDYEDVYYPITIVKSDGTTHDDHTHETGTVSVTSVGVHVIFTRNFGFSGGYRAYASLTNNSALSKDRSGPYFGFSIGI